MTGGRDDTTEWTDSSHISTLWCRTWTMRSQTVGVGRLRVRPVVDPTRRTETEPHPGTVTAAPPVNTDNIPLNITMEMLLEG